MYNPIQNLTSNGVSHITGGNFVQGSITINGWLRDFLWAQASQVIVWVDDINIAVLLLQLV